MTVYVIAYSKPLALQTFLAGNYYHTFDDAYAMVTYFPGQQLFSFSFSIQEVS
jgi:hypothetical protein